jgi:hypothetical protein
VPVLLAVQLVTLWQAGMRGLDYLGGPGGPALDATAAGPVAGLGLYLGVAVALVGIVGRWASPIIAGHLLVGVMYLALVGDALDRATPTPLAWAGFAVGAVGTWAALRRNAGTASRLAAGALMLGGQALIAVGLGGDYRTGTGLLGAGVIHLALSAGTFLLWQRRDLRVAVEAEVLRC